MVIVPGLTPLSDGLTVMALVPAPEAITPDAVVPPNVQTKPPPCDATLAGNAIPTVDLACTVSAGFGGGTIGTATELEAAVDAGLVTVTESVTCVPVPGMKLMELVPAPPVMDAPVPAIDHKNVYPACAGTVAELVAPLVSAGKVLIAAMGAANTWMVTGEAREAPAGLVTVQDKVMFEEPAVSWMLFVPAPEVIAAPGSEVMDHAYVEPVWRGTLAGMSVVPAVTLAATVMAGIGGGRTVMAPEPVAVCDAAVVTSTETVALGVALAVNVAMFVPCPAPTVPLALDQEYVAPA
jgi:hypothetical protein